METLNITFPPQTTAKLKILAFYNRFTREARGGQEEEWQRKLSEFDPELHLRWNWIYRHWAIYYNHHSVLSVIRVFKPGESFGQAFENVRHNSTLTTRKLQQMRKDENERDEKEVNYRIDECGAEFGEELHNATKERMITDGVKDNQY